MTEIFNRAEMKSRRKQLRRDSTDSEKALWSHLRKSQIDNLKFRRQASIGAYVVDFYAPELRLAIEVDGPSHNGPKHNRSIRSVKRFWKN